MTTKRKEPTLDQVIRDAVRVQSRLLRETGAVIEFHMTFTPGSKPERKPSKSDARDDAPIG